MTQLARPWGENHPFLTFQFDGRLLPPATWTLLGECSSKIEHISGTPLNADVAREFMSIFLAKGVHATTAIEGNTLSEEQVAKRVQGTLTLPPSQEYLGREIDNIVSAYNSLVDQLRAGVPFHVGPADLKQLNRTVLDGLAVEAGVVPGEYRLHTVTVSDYRAPSAEYVPELVEEGCRWLNLDVWSQPKGSHFVIPILRAILSHLYIAWIHPFGDGNGRTARLVEFDLLIRAGVPIVCAHLLSDHYNRTRSAYYRALSAARETPTHFIAYAVQGLLDMLREQLALVRVQQTQVTWINYVHSTFHDSTAQSRRCREVALCLAKEKGPIPAERIPALSPKLAAMYNSLTPRTLRRDIIELRRQRLVEVAKGGLSANLNLVRAFLPLAGNASSPNGASGALG